MNSYFYDSVGFSSVIESFQNQLDEYSKIVEKIMNLKDTIANSNEWVQDTIKSPFISKCDEYLLFYSKLSFLFNNVVVPKNKATAIIKFAANIIIS